MGAAPGKLVDLEAALRVVQAQGKAAAARMRRGTLELPLLDSLGYILGEDIYADRDQPAFDRSTRDGFAVRAVDWTADASLQVVGQVRAGERWQGEALVAGVAIEVMTGAPMPEGADAVVMVEHVVRAGGLIQAAQPRALQAGGNVVARGSEARAGTVLLQVGTRIGPAEIALAATCGLSILAVFRKPSVAIVATGDELVELDAAMSAHQIRNSNSYALAAMVTAAGGEPVRLQVAPDTREGVRARIAEGRKYGLLLLSGGVSMGQYDLVEEVLAEFGAEFFFTGVKMQPGKPVVFGRLPASAEAGECFFFGLPGNPVSTQVTFHCFAELMLRALGGEIEPQPHWVQATLAEAAAARAGVTRLLPCRMDGVSARIIPWQGSGDLAANARANCYVELLPERDYAAGEVLRVLLR